ncbi:MAG: exodeoxyribonuclease VII small subunit [Acidimicrobiales bacterium]
MVDDGEGPDSGREQESAWAAMTFEELVAELGRITEQMAAGDIGIERATELYERAGRLHAAAADRLAQVEERIEKLNPPN